MKKLVLQQKRFGPEHVLHRVDDSRVAHELVEPREQQVALVPQLAAERPAVRALDRLEARAIRGRLLAARARGSGSRTRHGGNWATASALRVFMAKV